MMNMTTEPNVQSERNQKIIDAVLRKEKQLCPGTIDLIGIYGSFATGDLYPGSDLDLLILINDDRGWKLGTGFILEDQQIGYDIYCTDRDSLRQDAQYTHPHISKLMDSRIVYAANKEAEEQLENLRRQVRKRLAEPFGEADYVNAERALQDAEKCFAEAFAADDLAGIRRQAGGVIYYVENAIALLNKTYYRKGVRRRYDELSAMRRRPDNLCELIDQVVSAGSADQIRDTLTRLISAVIRTFRDAKKDISPRREIPSAEKLSGTYEEMFSNWRNKMYLAAADGDRHLAFSSLESLDAMLDDIGSEVNIGTYNAIAAYDPDNLQKTAEAFDEILAGYENEYRTAGLQVRRYPDVDAFAEDYLNA